MTELLTIAGCLAAYAAWRAYRETLVAAYVDGLHMGHQITADTFSQHMEAGMRDAYRQGANDAIYYMQQTMPHNACEAYSHGWANAVTRNFCQPN